MFPSANYWLDKLQLIKHVEGGSFRETYRAAMVLPKENLSGELHGDRSVSTSIYFMLEQGQFSAFHRIASDEQWHFYYGGSLTVFEIQPGGLLIKHILGNDPGTPGDNFQCVVKAGSWFASKPADGVAYSLVGCTVAPGFDFADFELAKRNELIKLFPQHSELIVSLTRE